MLVERRKKYESNKVLGTLFLKMNPKNFDIKFFLIKIYSATISSSNCLCVNASKNHAAMDNVYKIV